MGMSGKSAFERWDGRFYYYALVRRGGAPEGRRPATRMAILTDCTFDGGKLLTARGFVGSTALTGWSGSKREVDPADIVKSWRSRPEPSVVNRERRKLAATPAPGPAGA